MGYPIGMDHDLLRFVLLKTGKPLFYGWKTYNLSSADGISETDLAFMDHRTRSEVTATSGSIAVIGANRPKPARYRFVLNKKPGAGEQGSITTFGGADVESLPGFEDSGWERVNDLSRVNIVDNNRSHTLGAKCENGGIYLYTCSKTMPNTVISELGLLEPTALRLETNLNKAFYGSSKPRPPKMSKQVTENYFATTFCSFDKIDDAMASGWRIVENSKTYHAGSVAPSP